MIIKLSLSLFLIFLASPRVQIEQDELETGWYFLTKDKQNSISFTDTESNELILVESNAIVTVPDIKKVKLGRQKVNSLWVNCLDITLTKEGNKKWNVATKVMSDKNKKAVFIYKNKVIHELSLSYITGYISPSIIGDDEDLYQLKELYNSIEEKIKIRLLTAK